MKVHMPSGNIYNVVDAVIRHGYAAVEGTKSMAIPYLERVRAALGAYEQVTPMISFQRHDQRGYLYFICDLSKFKVEEAQALVADLD